MSIQLGTCRFSERAVLRFIAGHFIVCYIRYTEPVAPVGSLPLTQKCCTSTWTCIIGRARASRATGAIYSDGPCHIPYRSKCFYFSVYATISLEPRTSCCLRLSSTMPSNAMHPSRSPSTHTMPGLQPIIPWSQLMLRCASTNNHAIYAFSTVSIFGRAGATLLVTYELQAQYI